MQQTREICGLDSSCDVGRSREVGGLVDAARYFGAVTIFVLGAVCFYLFIVIRTSWMESSKAQALVRHTIHNGARLLFYVLDRLSLVYVSEDESGGQLPHIDRPSVVVANHPSLLDALLLLSVVPNGVCIMKRALRSVPVISGFAQRAGYIPYSEAPELIQAATAELRRGGVVIVFPEGTRSPSSGCGPLQRGAVRIALEADVPLEVFGLRMKPVVLGRGLPWWRPPRAPILYQVVRLDSVRFEIDHSEGASERFRAESIKGTEWLEGCLKSWVS